uniref:Uncharacterized protein n=1 Tax=Oryza rufipogon TaxID=4529 RepID=A0A0E0NEY0_ORYRU
MASGSWSGRRDNVAAAGVLAPAFAAVGVHGSSLATVGVQASSLFAAGDHADVDGGSGGGWLGRGRDFTDPVGAGDGDGGNGGDCSGAAKRWRRRIWRRGRAGDDGATAARASMADLASGTVTGGCGASGCRLRWRGIGAGGGRLGPRSIVKSDIFLVEQPDIDDLERWAAGKARDSEVQYFENWSCARLGFSSSGCFNQHHNLDDVQAETGERILEQFKLIEKPGAVEAVESKHAQRSKRNTQNIKVSKLPPCT